MGSARLNYVRWIILAVCTTTTPVSISTIRLYGDDKSAMERQSTTIPCANFARAGPYNLARSDGLQRLRGGHVKPKLSRVGYKHKSPEFLKYSRRVHGMGRPHAVRRLEARQERRRAERGEGTTASSEEEELEERPPRFFEKTVGDVMQQVYDFRRRCPEVFQEWEDYLEDNAGFFRVREWQRTVVLPEDDSERWTREYDEKWRFIRSVAHYNLALAYDSGYGVECIDLAEAFRHFCQAGLLDHAEAAACAGACCMEGRGTKVDESEGLSWFRKSAALDGFEGQYNLGLCFARGAGGVQRNPELAVRWFNASAQNDFPDGMFALALSLDQGFGCRMDPVRAAQLLTSLCDKYHYPPAAMILATYYLNGRGVEKDLDLGEKLARFALMHGVTGAEEILREAGLSSAPSAETSSHVTTGVPPAKSEAKCGPDSDTFAGDSKQHLAESGR